MLYKVKIWRKNFKKTYKIIDVILCNSRIEVDNFLKSIDNPELMYQTNNEICYTLEV